MTYANRTEAGRRLATRLSPLRGPDVVVLGLPRGGIPVAAPVAIALEVPLGVLHVRKVGLPWRPEVAMGAVAEGGIVVIDEEIVSRTGVTPAALDAAVLREREMVDFEATHHTHRPDVPIAGRTAIVIDDGLATGATARAGCLAARAAGATRVVLAVPVAPPGWALPMHEVADEVVALYVPIDFRAVGQAYEDFSPTTEADVVRALTDANS